VNLNRYACGWIPLQSFFTSDLIPDFEVFKDVIYDDSMMFGLPETASASLVPKLETLAVLYYNCL